MKALREGYHLRAPAPRLICLMAMCHVISLPFTFFRPSHHVCDNLGHAPTTEPPHRPSPNPCVSSPRPSGWGTARTCARETVEGLVQSVAVPNVGLRGMFASLHYVIIPQLNPTRTADEME